jgi:hypothetical protein
MKTTGLSEADALRASKPTLIKPQWVDVRIESAGEHLSRREKETIELVLLVPDGSGGERTIKMWLTGAARGAVLLRHTCEAVGAISQHDAGEVTPDLFPGHVVAVKVGIRKQRGFPDQNCIDDVRAATGVVNLRRTG